MHGSIYVDNICIEEGKKVNSRGTKTAKYLKDKCSYPEGVIARLAITGFISHEKLIESLEHAW